MLQDKTFTAVRHDVIHTEADVFRSLPFVLGDKFDTPGHLRETRPEVPLSEFSRLVEKRHTVEVQQVENLDWSEISGHVAVSLTGSLTARPWVVLLLGPVECSGLESSKGQVTFGYGIPY